VKLDDAYDRLELSQGTNFSRIDQAIGIVRTVPALLVQ
jgi:hypothetical protein